jgi:hypothetical protein
MKFCLRKPILPPTSGPTRWEVDGDTRATAGAEGDVHGTGPRRRTPRSREPKHQATVDRDQRINEAQENLAAQEQHHLYQLPITTSD